MMNRYIFSAYTKANTRDFGKPNEDFVYVDRQNLIMLVLDGITRPHGEYAEGHDYIRRVNKVFADTATEYIKANPALAPDTLLKNAASSANGALLPLRKEKTPEEWEFYPATLGIISVIRQDKLWFCPAGDCIGMIIRNGVKIIFAEQQTYHALKILKVGKKERYESVCNNPECPYGYVIYNGDENVGKMLTAAGISLEKGDTVLIASDGMADFLRYEKAENIVGKSAEELAELSGKYDVEPYSEYADDKAIVIITVS